MRLGDLLVVVPGHQILVQREAADVHVHGADGAHGTVDRHRLAVEEPGIVAVYREVRGGTIAVRGAGQGTGQAGIVRGGI